MRIFKIFRSFDREQIRFVIDKKMAGSYTADEWLNRLNKVAFMDKLGDESRVKVGQFIFIFGLLGFITLLLSIIKPVLFFFPLGFLLVFIFFLASYISLIKLDMVNHLRIFLVPLLKILKNKIELNEKIYLKFEFSRPTRKSNLLQVVRSGNQRKEKIYKHNWIEAGMSFPDGVIVKWHVEDTINVWRSEIVDLANKFKFWDYELTHQLFLEFRFPLTSFNRVGGIQQKDNDYHILTMEETAVSKSLEEGLDPEIFMMAMDQAYRQFTKTDSSVNRSGQ